MQGVLIPYEISTLYTAGNLFTPEKHTKTLLLIIKPKYSFANLSEIIYDESKYVL